MSEVARAICTAGGNDPGRFWGENAEEEWKLYVDEARGAIAAMREPTEAMQIAGHNVRNDPATGMQTHCGTDEIYTAMIDAALAE